MAYKIRCTSCGKSMRLPEGDAGLPVVCLACGTKFVAPPPEGATPTGNAAGETRPVAALSDNRPPAHPAELPPPTPRPPARRLSWAWVAAACFAFLLVGAVVAVVVLRAGRGGGAAELAAMLNEAQSLQRAGKWQEAHRQYREIDRRATEIGTEHPDVKTVADQARFEQEQLYAAMLARRAPDPNAPAEPPPPGPTTAPGVAAGPTPAPDSPVAAARAATKPSDEGPIVSDAVADADPIMQTRPAATAPAVPDAVAASRGPEPAPVEPVPTASPPSRETAPATQAVARRRRPPLQPMHEPPSGVTDEQIGAAIQRGVNWLIPRFDPRTGQLKDLVQGGDEGYACGLNALCVYALLQAGQSIPDERLSVRGPFMKQLIEGMKRLPANTGKVTYARGIRATALALYARKEDRSALAADVLYLRETHIDGDYTYAGTRDSGSLKAVPGMRGDNSNAQYGLLGVWSGAEVDVEVPSAYWAAVHRHWVVSQAPDGMWGYQNPAAFGTISMTAAGTASLFVAEDYLYYARFGARVGREPFSPALKRALDWWEREADFQSPTTAWWGYTLYGIERVGLASGFKYFGKADWYRSLARDAISRQMEDGTWGEIVDTAYALLFLARGRHPILMNKLRFDRGGETGEQPGYWANRPRDAANLARYAGRQLERPLNWQVVGLDRAWHDWLDSPILSIASHRTPYFTDGDVEKFRQYVQAGGMLYLQADGESEEFDAFAKAFARRVFPEYPLGDLPLGHLLYNALYKVDPPPPLKAVTNGSRVLMLYSPTDLSKAWQLREERAKENVYRLGVNLFVYAAGKRELRNRLSSPYVPPPPGQPPPGMVGVARVTYDGSWDPEPGAWRRFANWFPRHTGGGLNVNEVALRDVGSLNPAAGAAVAHLTGVAAFTPSPEELNAMRAYVDRGGVLLIDAVGGALPFVESMKSAVARAFPETVLQSLPRHHPLLNDGEPGMDDLSKPRLRPYVLERTAASGTLRHLRSGKGAVILSEMDVTSGLLGTETWGIFGYDPSYAQSLVKNVIFWAMDGTPGLN